MLECEEEPLVSSELDEWDRVLTNIKEEDRPKDKVLLSLFKERLERGTQLKET